MPQGFEEDGAVWILMDVQDGWPYSAYADKVSAEEALRQVQDAEPDRFFKICFSEISRWVDNNQVEEDDWL